MNNNTIKYKNTNNDFVPQIPENWEFLKMRHIGNLYSGLAVNSSDIDHPISIQSDQVISV